VQCALLLLLLLLLQLKLFAVHSTLLRVQFLLQLAQRQAQKGAVSFQSLSNAIVKALELARLHPHLDPRDLLHPAIAELQLSYVDRAVRRMRHVLPDTKLRAELLAKGGGSVRRTLFCLWANAMPVRASCVAGHEAESRAAGQRCVGVRSWFRE
jgi:hypothetical protein